MEIIIEPKDIKGQKTSMWNVWDKKAIFKDFNFTLVCYLIEVFM